MTNYKQAIGRQDSREYYALSEVPESLFRIVVENAQNYALNHLQQLGKSTLSDFFGTDSIESLTLEKAIYIMILRYNYGHFFPFD